MYARQLQRLLVLLAAISTCFAGGEYKRWYQNLSAGIQAAQGQAIVTFAPDGGSWITKASGTTAIWTLQPGTTAQVVFNYDLSVLQKGSVTFTPAINVKMSQGARCLAIRITSIQYAALGSIPFNGVTFSYANAATCRDQLSPWLYSHLQFAQAPDAFFQGAPFSTSSSAQASNGQGTVLGTSTPLIWRVQFFPSRDSNGNPLPALGVTLRSNTMITLAQNDQLTLSEGSLRFNSLEYDTVPGIAFGRLDQLNMKIFFGQIHAGATKLVFQQNDVLTFENIDFSKDTQNVSFNNGTLRQMALGDGSSIALAAPNGHQSYLDFGNGTNATLNGINVAVQDGGLQTISVDSGVLALVIKAGTLALAGQNSLGLGPGTVQATLDRALWSSGTSPSVQGSLTGLSTSITSGLIQVDGQSVLKLGGGQVGANKLLIDTSNAGAPIRGTIQTAQIALANGTNINIPGRLTVSVSGGNVAAATPQQPLEFSDSIVPKGGIDVTLDVAAGVIPLSTIGIVNLAGGTLGGHFIVTPEAPLSGTVDANVRIGPSSLTLDAANNLNVTSGTIEAKQLSTGNGPTGLSGTLTRMELKLGSGHFEETGSFAADLNDGGSALIDSSTVPFTFGQGQARPAGKIFIHLPIRNGTVIVGHVGTINIAGEFIDATLTAVPGQPVEGTVALSVLVSGGSLRINDSSLLNIQSGALKAQNLAFRAGDGLSGPFTRVDIRFGPSTLQFSDGIGVTTLNSSSFTAADATSPFRIVGPAKVVAGRFSILADVDRFQNAANRAFEVRGGKIDFELENLENGQIVTPASAVSFLRGSQIDLTTAQGDSVSMTVDLNNAKLTVSPSEPALFVADLAARFTNFTLHIATDGKEGYVDSDGGKHDDARFFSLHFDVGLDPSQPTIIAANGFTLRGSSVQTPLTAPVHLTLSIPQGDGEHPNSSIHEPGNHGGGDRFANAEEVFTDTFPACRLHMYLFQGTYSVAATLDLSTVQSDRQIRVADISLSPAITRNQDSTTGGWDRDGCDSILYKAIVIGFTSFVSTVILGPGGLVVGPVLGAKLIDFANDRLDNLANAHIAAYIQGRSFTRKIP